MVTAKGILDRVKDLIGDVDGVTWIETELIRWINDGRVAIIKLKPAAGAVTLPVLLIAGPRQVLPANAITMIRQIGTSDVEGAAPSTSVKTVSIETLDAQFPGWKADTSSATVLLVAPDYGKDSKVFYVYPPQPIDPGYLLCEYSAVKTDLTGPTSPLDMGDEFIAPLVDYVCHRCLSGDREVAEAGLAAKYFTAFLLGLGINPPETTKAKAAE